MISYVGSMITMGDMPNYVHFIVGVWVGLQLALIVIRTTD